MTEYEEMIRDMTDPETGLMLIQSNPLMTLARVWINGIEVTGEKDSIPACRGLFSWKRNEEIDGWYQVILEDEKNIPLVDELDRLFYTPTLSDRIPAKTKWDIQELDCTGKPFVNRQAILDYVDQFHPLDDK